MALEPAATPATEPVPASPLPTLNKALRSSDSEGAALLTVIFTETEPPVIMEDPACTVVIVPIVERRCKLSSVAVWFR